MMRERRGEMAKVGPRETYTVRVESDIKCLCIEIDERNNHR